MATSYLRNNDYQIYNKRPYQLPAQAAMQEYAAKVGYWQEGISKIQQARANVLNLNPQFQQNKEYLKNYLDNATKQVQGMMSSDLGIQDNANKASKIYSGIFDTSNPDNATLLKDDQINKFYQEQERMSNSARTSVGKNGKMGENWNSANDFYFRTAYNKYLTDAKNGDISKIDENFQQRKAYVPYYDYSDEVDQAIKNCKASSSETQRVSENYLYLNNRSYRGVSAERMQGCMSMISDKAKEQIGIESYQNYYNNRQGLAEDYKNKVIGTSTERLQILDAKLAVAQKAGANELVSQLQQEKEGLQRELNKNITILQNPDFINSNYENIASQVGFLNWSERAGITYSWEEVLNKLSPNAAGIAIFKAQQEERMEGIRFNNDMKELSQRQSHDWRIEEYKARNEWRLEEMKQDFDLRKAGLKTDAEGNLVSAVGGNPVNDVNLSNGNDINFTKDLHASITDTKSAANGLVTAAKEYLKDPKISKEVRESLNGLFEGGTFGYTTLANLFQIYDESGQKDPMLDRALANFKQKWQIQQTFYDQKASVEAQLKDKLPSNNSHNFNIGSMPVSFTDMELVELKNGKSVKGWKYEHRDWGTSTLISPNGKRISNFGEMRFNTAMRDATSQMNEYLEDRNKLLNENYVSSQKWFTGPEFKTESYTQRDNAVRNQLNLPEDIIVTSSRQDAQGNAVFKFSKKTKEGGIQPLTKEEEQAYNLSSTNGWVEVKNFYSPLPDYMNTQNNRSLTSFVDRSLRELPEFGWSEPRQFQNKNGVNFDIKVGKHLDSPIFEVSKYVPGIGWDKINIPYESKEALLLSIEQMK